LHCAKCFLRRQARTQRCAGRHRGSGGAPRTAPGVREQRPDGGSGLGGR
jgi:hypothetical protein